ncbi:MAG: hypothetical protein AB8G23_03430 [Myxococcota bacterium]
MEDQINETASWLDTQLEAGTPIELEIGSFIAAASDWTEDETELDDFVSAMVETDQFSFEIG